IHCGEGITGDECAVGRAEQADMTGRMSGRLNDFPSRKPGKLAQAQRGDVRREISLLMRCKAHHLREEATHGGISRRIEISAVNKWKFHAMNVDAHAPATSKLKRRAGMIEMSVSEHNGAGRWIFAQMFANSAQDFLLISRCA